MKLRQKAYEDAENCGNADQSDGGKLLFEEIFHPKVNGGKSCKDGDGDPVRLKAAGGVTEIFGKQDQSRGQDQSNDHRLDTFEEGFEEAVLRDAVASCVPAKALEVNMKAYDAAREMIG